jgi:hypothetical protein
MNKMKVIDLKKEFGDQDNPQSKGSKEFFFVKVS